MGDPSNKSIMRSLGEFFGHIARAVKHDPAAPVRQEVKREVQEETRDTPQGKMTLRRTTIEEIEINPNVHQKKPENRVD